MPGGGGGWNEGRLRRGGISADDRALAASEERAERPAEMAAKSVAPSAAPAPMQSAPAPRHEVVTAGMVDDNADFGEYLAYRQRNAGLPVRERDIAVELAPVLSALMVAGRSGAGIATELTDLPGSDGLPEIPDFPDLDQ